MTIETALLVDDDPDIRTLGRIALEDVGGMKVHLADSGEQALEIVSAASPDVIVLDVMMPRLDGPGTLERLRAEPSTASIPIVFLTAKVQKSEVDRYLALGAAGVVAKPFDPITLHQEIRDLVAGS